MSFPFNLIHEPWISCVTADGDIIELGLFDTLVDADRLREITDSSPLVVAALHRLALTILHRVFGPESYEVWGELWRTGRWPHEPLERYFEEWYDRFELFHPQRPFFQAEDNRVKPKSLIHLVHSSNNNPTLFGHETEEEGVTFTPAQAARELLAAQAFHVAGLSGLKEKFTDAPCARGVIFLAQGQNLFKTLALNLIRYPEQEGPFRTSRNDRPAWEMDNPFSPVRTRPLGYLDYFTWHNLRVMFLPELGPDGILVRQVTIGPGLGLDADLRDPMKLYRADKAGQGFKVMRLSEHRSLWRSTHTFLALRSQLSHPPASLGWLSELVYEGYLSPEMSLRYMALGMSSHQAKVFFYRHESMPLSLAYLQRQELVGHLEQVISLSEDVARALNWALKTLAQFLIFPASDQPGARQPDSKRDVQPLVDHWGVTRHYWGDLEPFFWQLVESLPNSPDQALASWKAHLWQAAIQAYEHAEELAGPSPAALKAAAEGRRRLFGSLKKALQ
jgi:CRISPR system Cascade subunit CasA